MLQQATGFYIWVSLGIIFTLTSLAECERCLLDCSECRNPSFLGLDYGHECQNKFPETKTDGCCSELCSSSLILYGPQSHAKENSSDDFMFHYPDGLTFACFTSLMARNVNYIDQVVLFPGRGQLLCNRRTVFTSQNIEIEKSLSAELSSHCLSITPEKLDWGQNYIYHPSVAFLRLKNICDEKVIKVYKPFSTDSQFYPFNYSEVRLGPGHVTSIYFVFLPKWLGFSSAELVLQTSLGGFLVQAKGVVIESPYRNENILGETLSPYSEEKILGAACMELLRPLDGKNETIPSPFKTAVISNTSTWEEIVHPLSVSVEVVGSPGESETTISVSVKNSGSHLLKIISIAEVSDSKKLLKIKYMEGLLIFPGSVTQVALVTYNTSDVYYDSFVEMGSANTNCGLEIQVNDSTSSTLGVPCEDIFGFRRQKDLYSFRTGSLSSIVRSSVLTKTMDNTDVDEFVLQKWRDQSTVSGLYILEDRELVFPVVPLDRYSAKFITVKNPSQQPITVHLILNSHETVDNCKLHNSHLPSPWSSDHIHHDYTSPPKYGFSLGKNSVTEAFLHPHATVLLGPIFFHPSNRCEWKSSAILRNNLSGVEQLSMHGFGGLLSLVLSEGCRSQAKAPFQCELAFFSKFDHCVNTGTSSLDETSSGYRKPLVKNQFALNSGDFDVKVENASVSGETCGLELMELGISYQTDFSRPVMQRDLDVKLADGMLVRPMKVSTPIDMLSFCRKSFFWVQVKRCWIAMVLAVIIIMLLFWITMLQLVPSNPVDQLVNGEKRSNPVVRPAKKSVKLTKMGRGNSRQGYSKTGITADHADCRPADLPDAPSETSFSPTLISKSLELEKNIKEGPPVCLAVRTRKDKKRRARKRSGPTTSGLVAHPEVSSSQSGNSTPSTPSPKSLRSPFLEESRSHESSGCRSVDYKANTSSKEPIVPVEVMGNRSDNPSYTQQQPLYPNSTVNRPMLLPSATFPGTGRSSLSQPCSYSTGLATAPHARAPGPKIKPQKAAQAEERTDAEVKFTYDIWGNHCYGLHLMGSSDGSFSMVSEYIKGHSGSFFVRDPQETLLTNSAPLTVSRSIGEG